MSSKKCIRKFFVMSLVLLVCSEIPVICHSWRANHVDQLVKALDFLQWNNVSIASAKVHTRFLERLAKASHFLVKYEVAPTSKADFVISQENLPIFMGEEFPDSTLYLAKELSHLRSLWANISYPISFFAASPSSLARGSFYRIFTRRGNREDLECEVTFDPSSAPRPPCLHDAMGVELSVETLEYSPFVILQNCPSNGTKCDLQGVSVDLLNLLSVRGNFTWTGNREKTDTWGSFPPPGANGSLAETPGLIGRTLRREIDIPLSAWVETTERRKWADFSLSSGAEVAHCFAELGRFQFADRLFLVRPFKVEAWVAVVAVMGGLGFVMAGAEAPKENGRDRRGSLQVCSLVAGLLFTVISAFYGGALTMFLAQQPESPFSDLPAGLKMEGWTLLLARGDEGVFRNNFDMKDPLIRDADSKYNSEEFRQTQAASFKETLLELKSVPNSILFASKSRVMQQLNDLGKDTIEVLRFCNPVVVPYSLMLPKRSPFRSVFDRGLIRMHERGEIKRLENKWFREIIGHKTVTVPGVTLGQIQLGFVLFACTGACALVALTCEYIWNKRWQTLPLS